MGLRPSAKAPPWDPKNPWFTKPPVAPPEPEFMEYAFEFQRELIQIAADEKQGKKKRAQAHAMLAAIKPWIARARQLYDRRLEDIGLAGDDLTTTDGILLAVEDCLARVRSRLESRHGEFGPRDFAVLDAVKRRNWATRERYATDPKRGRGRP